MGWPRTTSDFPEPFPWNGDFTEPFPDAELEDEPCPDCGGTGAVDTPFSGSDPVCGSCDGRGTK